MQRAWAVFSPWLTLFPGPCSCTVIHGKLGLLVAKSRCVDARGMSTGYHRSRPHVFAHNSWTVVVTLNPVAPSTLFPNTIVRLAARGLPGFHCRTTRCTLCHVVPEGEGLGQCHSIVLSIVGGTDRYKLLMIVHNAFARQ